MSADRIYTVEDARKALAVIDAGLVMGLGQPVPGRMCVEAAICYSLGLPHGDDPGCVSTAVRIFKIVLNDAPWSSSQTRAAGLRALAIAQLGSKGTIDDSEFGRRLMEATIRQIVPLALRAVAVGNPQFAVLLEEAAVRCEREGTVAAADAAETTARRIVHYNNAFFPVIYAVYAADYAVKADTVVYAALYAAEIQADAIAADAVLAKSASLALEVLRAMGAPGIALLDAVQA